MPRPAIAPFTLLACAAATAHAQVYTFETLAHGEIITNQFQPALTITTDNFTGPDIVAAFDTTMMGTADPDLQGPPWAAGNLAPNTILGKALIIAENGTDANNDGILDNPDDEASRPAGIITLTFANAIDRFGFDVIDIEGNLQESSSLDFYLAGNFLATITFAEFLDGGTFDRDAVYGNNSANRIAPITAAEIGAVAFDEVIINVGGSSAYDNFVVPAPSTTTLTLVGLLATTRRRR